MSKPLNKKPKFMITYFCRNCGFDFGRTELDNPRCFYCNSSKDFEVIKKEPLTPQVMAERLKKVTDRMMENLQKAYHAGKENSENFDELELLKIMTKAKKLKDDVQNLPLGKNKN